MKFDLINAWQSQRNIGPVMSKLLAEAELSPKDLQQMSVEDFFLKFWQCHQKPQYVHSAYLYALHGAKYEMGWTDLSETDKQKYKQFCKDFKKSWR